MKVRRVTGGARFMINELGWVTILHWGNQQLVGVAVEKLGKGYNVTVFTLPPNGTYNRYMLVGFLFDTFYQCHLAIGKGPFECFKICCVLKAYFVLRHKNKLKGD
jgi:hypothetical protein